MPTATISPGLVQLGAGILRTAPLATAEPVDLTTAWGAGWVEVGGTNEGSTFTSETTVEDVLVAESLDRIKVVSTGRSISVAFAFAEITATNLQKAFNGGTIVTGTAAAPKTFVTFEPPDVGTENRIMLGWDSEDGQERWIFRQCFNGGAIEMARRKAPDKTLIPVNFGLEKPTDGTKPFRAYLANARAGTGFLVNP